MTTQLYRLSTDILRDRPCCRKRLCLPLCLAFHCKEGGDLLSRGTFDGKVPLKHRLSSKVVPWREIYKSRRRFTIPSGIIWSLLLIARDILCWRFSHDKSISAPDLHSDVGQQTINLKLEAVNNLSSGSYLWSDCRIIQHIGSPLT